MERADAALDRFFERAHARYPLITRKCFCRSCGGFLLVIVLSLVVTALVLQSSGALAPSAQCSSNSSLAEC